MKKFIKSEFIFLLVCLFFVLFNVIFFVATDLANLNAGAWFAYAFIDLAFIIVAAFSLGFKFKASNLMTTLEPLAAVCGGYLLLSLLVNIILIAVNPAKATASIIINVIILIIFAAVVLIVYKSVSHVADNTAKREARMFGLRELAIKVNSLIFLAKDDEISAEIKKLKDTLDYSSSAGNQASAEYEEKFAAQIETVEMLLIQKADKESVLSAVETASNFWKLRNQMLMAGNGR